MDRNNGANPTNVEKGNKAFFVHSAEGYSSCGLTREPFLPDLTVKETLIRPLQQQRTEQKSIEHTLQRNDIHWTTLYLLPQKTTIESRMHIFQHNILNNILHLNNKLRKFGYIKSPV